jgi:hypothetical protein
MLPVERESDRICDMDQIGSGKLAEAALSLSPHLREVLDSSVVTLTDVMNQFP